MGRLKDLLNVTAWNSSARMDETPDEGLIARHQREIAPLLKRRKLFAESTHFVLYDFWTGQGTVDENVFAYSNRLGDQRAVILYNNSYGSTHGTIHASAASMDKGSGRCSRRGSVMGLDFPVTMSWLLIAMPPVDLNICGARSTFIIMG